MPEIIQLIWNGCDGYFEVDRAPKDANMDINSEGTAFLYHRAKTYYSFPVIEIGWDAVPMDGDDEYVFDGLFVSERNKVYRPA